MRLKKLVFASCFLIMIFVLTAFTSAETGGSQETLKQYIGDLQKNPDDFALREKVINLVQGMRHQPAVPEEAERYFARGKAAVKGASTAKDFLDAANEFNKALTIAPWLAEGYYNLGIVQNKAGRYQDAIRSLKLYLLAAPNAPDVKEVKSLMFEIEYRQEKAQREAVAKKEEEAKPDFSGEWGWAHIPSPYRYKFLISGRELTITVTTSEGDEWIHGTGIVDGRNFEGSDPGGQRTLNYSELPKQFKGSLSEDNKTIQISEKTVLELARTKETRELTKEFIRRFNYMSEWGEPSTWIRVSK